jgi:DUF438 domain-containing protein
MDKIEKLTEILQKLNSGEISDSLKKEALEMVAKIDPVELSLAEQSLIEKGTKPEDLRNLCEIHMEVLKDELDNLKVKINSDHVLSTLIAEHDEILKLLTKLDELNHKIQKIENYTKDLPQFDELLKLSEDILGAEKHHKREEDVLFPELEKRNVTGPTRIMRMEHDILRAKKKEIKNLALEVGNMDFNAFKSSLAETSKYLIFNMRDHIYKENHILYPSSLDTLTDVKLWNDMKIACDKIGYCSFTPRK